MLSCKTALFLLSFTTTLSRRLEKFGCRKLTVNHSQQGMTKSLACGCDNG